MIRVFFWKLGEKMSKIFNKNQSNSNMEAQIAKQKGHYIFLVVGNELVCSNPLIFK